MGYCTVMASAGVTGGAGFVGSHLCDRLLGAGVRVTAVDNLLSGSFVNLARVMAHPGFRLVRGDHHPAAQPWRRYRHRAQLRHLRPADGLGP